MAIKKKGIDISVWQGDIDAVKMKNSGIDFVILREGFRQSTDSRFFENVKKCKAAGLNIIGVYHFSYALNVEQAKQEAKSCVSNIQKAGLGKETIVFFDFEYDTVTKAMVAGVTLGKSECNAHTEAFCETVESLGYKAGIYFNLDFYKNWYEHELLDKYTKWLADWSGEADYECEFHQYTSKGEVPGINGNVDMNYHYEMEEEKMEKSRQAVVELALSWVGRKESDGSHKYIVDIYNSFTGEFPRGTKMDPSWAWCACTWSAIAIKLGYTAIMPIEISCGYLIDAAKKMGCWQENDAYVGKPGDAILYDWDDNGVGDDTGWPEHVGTIVETHEDAGYFVVVEGNYDNAVKKRTLSINGRYIRGFITPKYDDNNVSTPDNSGGKDVKTVAREVIAGTWGNGEARKKALEAKGYNYDEVQSMVNQILNGSAVTPSKPEQKPSQSVTKKVVASCAAHKFDKGLAGTYRTTANLYCRNDAGTNKKALCLIPENTPVNCYGYYNIANGVRWLYIQFVIDGVQYTGFSSSAYLKR